MAPTVGRDRAKRSAVKHLMETFFYESPLGHLGCAVHIAMANATITQHIDAAEKE